jgi:hypothetical protein
MWNASKIRNYTHIFHSFRMNGMTLKHVSSLDCLSVYLSIGLSICIFICLSNRVRYLSVCLSIRSVYLTAVRYLSVCLSIRPIYLSICLSVCPWFIYYRTIEEVSVGTNFCVTINMQQCRNVQHLKLLCVISYSIYNIGTLWTRSWCRSSRISSISGKKYILLQKSANFSMNNFTQISFRRHNIFVMTLPE